MSKDDIASLLSELDALEKKAAPGPWGARHGDNDEDLVIAGRALVADCNIWGLTDEEIKGNVAFIAALRNAYPKLRDALTKGTVLSATAQKHLQSALLYCGGAMQYASHHCQNLEGDISAIRQQIELALSSVEKVED